jgi:Domain of unknown function (DUF4440)
LTDVDLVELEERGWQALSAPSPVAFCEEWLADDAMMIVPGMVIDRETFLQAVAHEQPWSSHTIRDSIVLQLAADSAALIYRVTARRQGRPEFTGVLTSVYAIRDGRWRLMIHQQTPSPTA